MLVTVTVDDARADSAIEILRRHHAVDVEEREAAPGTAESLLEKPGAQPTTSDVRRERDRLHARDVRRYPIDTGDDEFRRHHASTFAAAGGPYEDYAAAYAFGRDLAANRHDAGADWSVMEPEARRQWQERRPGTWDRCHDAIQYGWEQSRRRPAA
jgi:hypothetical protein